jgi:predicted SnoaL-like aldol condensation-catalyzing enzyme
VTRSAREVVELYNLQVWNDRDLALAAELFADTVVRHEVGESHVLTHDQAVARVADLWEMFGHLRFELPVVVADADGEHVAIVYDSTMTAEDGDALQVGSIEVFRVVDGKITEVWNCGHKVGRWT